MSSVPYLPLYLPKGPQYRCPGERYDISYSVHLGRIASGFPACRNCPQRTETGELSPDLLTWLDRTDQTQPQRSLFTPEGVRGIYLNDLNRKIAGDLAGKFARLLWERNPPRVKPRSTSNTNSEENNESNEQIESPRTGPLVLVGHDERPHSPDLLTGVVQVLRRMSCQVLNAGTVPVPWFQRLMTEHQATAAIHIGASGEAPGWSGMNFWSTGCLPCVEDHLLPEIESAYGSGLQRPSRSSSGYRTIHTNTQYEDRLKHLFHALRPLKIVVGCANRMGTEILQKMLATTACELIIQQLPRKKTDWSSVADPDRKGIASVVRERGGHLGCLIGEDLQETVFLDETGEPVAWPAVGLFAAEEMLIENSGMKAVVSERMVSELETPFKQRGITTERVPNSRTQIVQHMNETGAKLGIDSGRIWFEDGGTVCDGLMLLGNLLQAMSRSDLELSKLSRQILTATRPLRG